MIRIVRCFVFLLLLSALPARSAAPAISYRDDLKDRMGEQLTIFIKQFDDTDFKDLISLGDPALFVSHLNDMTVELDPNFSKQGKYYPRVSGLQYIMNDKMVVNAVGGTATKTLWHEMIHRVIFRKGGGAPCPEEEAYTYLSEDRVSWLQRVKSVEVKYKAGEYDSSDLKSAWELTAERWDEFEKGFSRSNLGGPYASQDADDTCGQGTAIFTEIGPAFIKKWDGVVGININVNSLAEHFKPKIEFLEKTEEIEAALKACDYEKVKKLLTEIGQIGPKDDLMNKWEKGELPGIKLRADAVEGARESIKRAEAAESSGEIEDAIGELDKALYQPGFPDCLRKEVNDLKKKLELRKKFRDTSREVEDATKKCDYGSARSGISEIHLLSPLETEMSEWITRSEAELDRLEENERKAISLIQQAETQTTEAESVASAKPVDEARLKTLITQAGDSLTQADKIAPNCLEERKLMEALRKRLEALNKKPAIESSIILLIDTSGSMSSNEKISKAKAAAKRAARQVSRTTEIAILNFDGGCGPGAMKVAADFTTDLNTLLSAIESLRPGGGTPMYISTARAVEHAQKSGSGKQRNIVLMSDGGDTCRSQKAQAASTIRTSNIPVSTIGFDVGNNQQAQSDLVDLATMTGGRTFSASAADPNEIIRAFNLAILPSLLKDFDLGSDNSTTADMFDKAKKMVQEKNVGEALRLLKQANQTAPRSANLNFNLSLLYEAEDQLIPAVDHAKSYLELAPVAIDRSDVENRIQQMEEELRRNPRTVMNASGCRDVLVWAQRERDVARSSKDAARVQAILGILISSQRGECDKARPLADAYKRRYP